MFSSHSDENLPLMTSAQDVNSLLSSPMQSPSKSLNDIKSNLSAKDIFRIANQSVDEFLNEIEAKNQISDISLPELHHVNNTIPQSPVTEPLHVEKNLLDDLDSIHEGISDNDDITDNSAQLNISNKIISHELNGPKPLIESPTKSPSRSPGKTSLKSPLKSPLKSLNSSPSKSPKKVKIDSSPIRVHNYEVEKDSDIETDDESEDLIHEKTNLNWSKVPIKPFDKKHTTNLLSKLSKLPSKPLPKIVPSKSDLSIKSMPNLDFLDLDSDDSTDLNLLQSSPSSATRIAAPKRNSSANSIAIPSTKNNFNQFYYDHDHYIQDMQSGNLVESNDIKSNKIQSETLKKDLIESNPISSSEQSRNNLLDNFQSENHTNDNNKSDLDRSSSIKSEMSISAADCKLETKLLKASLKNSEHPEHDNIIKLNKTDDFEKYDKENENDNDADLSLNISKQRSPKHEKRTSSPLAIVGNVISSLVTGMDPDPAADDDLQQDESDLKKTTLRNISTQSVATTITDSGFVSASEGNEYSNNDDKNLDDEDNSSIYDDNTKNENHENKKAFNPDETIDTIVVTPTREDFEPSTLQTISNIESLKSSHDDQHEVSEQDVQDKQNVSNTSSDTSFNSDNFVLHVPFEDDIFDTEFDEFNKNMQSRTVSSASSNSSKSRIVSIERAERNDMLNIWSKQRGFNLPTRKHTEFDSISAPIKSYIVNENHPKAVKIVNNTIPKPRITSDQCSPSNWIYHKLEVLPNGVNKKLITSNGTELSNFSKSDILPSISNIEDSIQISKHNLTNKLNTTNEINESIEDAEYTAGEDINNLSGSSVIRHNDSLMNTDPHLSMNFTRESNNDSMVSQIDNSLLNEIKNWNPDHSLADQSNNAIGYKDHIPRQDSIEILKQVWNNNTSSDCLGLNLTHSDTFQRLSGKDIEDFLNKKRTISDEYHVKQADHSKAQIRNDYFNPPEQKAYIYKQFGNESYSKIVPDLGIADLDNEGHYNYDFDNESSINEEDNNSNFNLKLQGNNNVDNGEDIHTIISQNSNINLAYPINNAVNPPKSPVLPARQKMVEKFEEQMRQKKEQEGHKQLQENLHQKIREEAQTMQTFYPPLQTASNPSSPTKILHGNENGRKTRIHSVNEDSLDNIYEDFDNSPTKISINNSKLKPEESPERSVNNNLLSENPFESPKIKSMINDNKKNLFTNPRNIQDDHSLNPFEKNEIENANFEKIPSTVNENHINTVNLNKVSSPENTKAKEHNNKLPIQASIPNIKSKEPKLVNGEQGRLFLKLQDITGLRLPDLKKRNAQFQLLLDNGIHCIKTEFVDIGNKNTIQLNKEFELVVAEKLNVVITLKLKYDKPKPKTIQVQQEQKVKSKSVMGKLMGKKETKMVKKMITQPAEEDLLAPYISSDGSFSKLKINFEDYKKQIFAKPNSYSLTCFNEWKTMKSEKGVVKNYKSIPICTLNLKMMFIPHVNENEILPISISNAIAQLKEAKKVHQVKNEGYMSQEGGDVEMWTKRLYKLDNYDLFAYNISNNKLKAKINLRKVVQILSPKNINNNNNAHNINNQGKRDFTDIDNVILNNGFKIKFGNNETISFECDNSAERDQWINCIEQLITMKKIEKQPWLNSMMEAMKDFPINSMIV